ncbi:selenium cofactor biosynthesis protein YqeC [Chloroflexota bacterium]
MLLKEALNIKHREVISLVGGGGKTTLMFALARELATDDGCVITTTTTKIRQSLPQQTPHLLMARDEAELIGLFLQNTTNHRQVTLATERLTSTKLVGIHPELVNKLADMEQVTHIIVETDGAAGKSLKAPNATEPVIPTNTSLVIAVVGADTLGCRLTEETVFRSEIVSKLLGVPLGSFLSTESIASLITHRQGIIKGSPERARIIPFINKLDLCQDLSLVRNLALKILAKGHHQINMVLLGQANLPQPMVKVISGETR